MDPLSKCTYLQRFLHTLYSIHNESETKLGNFEEKLEYSYTEIKYEGDW